MISKVGEDENSIISKELAKVVPAYKVNKRFHIYYNNKYEIFYLIKDLICLNRVLYLIQGCHLTYLPLQLLFYYYLFLLILL